MQSLLGKGIGRNGEVTLMRLADVALDQRLTCGDTHFLLSDDCLVGFGGSLPAEMRGRPKASSLS